MRISRGDSLLGAIKNIGGCLVVGVSTVHIVVSVDISVASRLPLPGPSCIAITDFILNYAARRWSRRFLRCISRKRSTRP
jgi:hypothetical protein